MKNVPVTTWLNVTTQATVCRSASLVPVMLSDARSPSTHIKLNPSLWRDTKFQIHHSWQEMKEKKSSMSLFKSGTNSVHKKKTNLGATWND